MIPLYFGEKPSEAWFARADNAMKAAICAVGLGLKPEFASAVYADSEEVRDRLRRLQHNKCAYCETIIIRAHGDVEHYRPKAKVTEDPSHPGYYWLAFDWSNYVLACGYCNQPHKRGGQSAGKANHFPLAADGRRAVAPTDSLAAELPLLLNPRQDDPGEHLEFDAAGHVHARAGSARGEATIAICDLDADPLLVDRRRQHFAERLLPVATALFRGAHEEAQREAAAKALELVRDDQEYAQLARQLFTEPKAFGF